MRKEEKIEEIFKAFPAKYRQRDTDGSHLVHWQDGEWSALEDLSTSELNQMWEAISWEADEGEGLVTLVTWETSFASPQSREVPYDHALKMAKEGGFYKAQVVGDFDEILFESGQPQQNPTMTQGEANTILKQMGGYGRLRAMIGLKNVMVGESKEGYPELHLRFPNQRGPNYVKIEITPQDLYNIAFFRKRKYKLHPKGEFHGIYWDQLKPIFEKETGLYLSLYNNPYEPRDDGKVRFYDGEGMSHVVDPEVIIYSVELGPDDKTFQVISSTAGEVAKKAASKSYYGPTIEGWFAEEWRARSEANRATKDMAEWEYEEEREATDAAHAEIYGGYDYY